ncbi:hypothetical protein LCGC14_1359020 [marine sediment metagenome]|uniref:Uncharacterized protein n=1 Tax=marine sediment metagenome TaxID=412755 RepID=A0A0F9NAW0_9ZZZZ
MCCKDDQGRAKVLVPLGVGSALDAEDQVEFVRWSDMYITNEEAARRFKKWMRDTVSGEFYDILRQELNADCKGE